MAKETAAEKYLSTKELREKGLAIKKAWFRDGLIKGVKKTGVGKNSRWSIPYSALDAVKKLGEGIKAKVKTSAPVAKAGKIQSEPVKTGFKVGDKFTFAKFKNVHTVKKIEVSGKILRDENKKPYPSAKCNKVSE